MPFSPAFTFKVWNYTTLCCSRSSIPPHPVPLPLQPFGQLFFRPLCLIPRSHGIIPGEQFRPQLPSVRPGVIARLNSRYVLLEPVFGRMPRLTDVETRLAGVHVSISLEEFLVMHNATVQFYDVHVEMTLGIACNGRCRLFLLNWYICLIGYWIFYFFSIGVNTVLLIILEAGIIL